MNAFKQALLNVCYSVQFGPYSWPHQIVKLNPSLKIKLANLFRKWKEWSMFYDSKEYNGWLTYNEDVFLSPSEIQRTSFEVTHINQP